MVVTPKATAGNRLRRGRQCYGQNDHLCRIGICSNPRGPLPGRYAERNGGLDYKAAGCLAVSLTEEPFLQVGSSDGIEVDGLVSRDAYD